MHSSQTSTIVVSYEKGNQQNQKTENGWWEEKNQTKNTWVILIILKTQIKIKGKKKSVK